MKGPITHWKCNHNTWHLVDLSLGYRQPDVPHHAVVHACTTRKARRSKLST